MWLTRLLVYIGLFVGVGGAFFLAWITRLGPATPIPLVIAAALLWAFWRLRSRSVSRGWTRSQHPSLRSRTKTIWVGGLETPYGPTAVIAVLALVCGFFSLAVPGRWQARSLSLLGLIGVGGALTASGHASTAEPQWLMRPSVFFHVIGLVFWIGALSPLICVQIKSDFGSATIAVTALLRGHSADPAYHRPGRVRARHRAAWHSGGALDDSLWKDPGAEAPRRRRLARPRFDESVGAHSALTRDESQGSVSMVHSEYRRGGRAGRCDTWARGGLALYAAAPLPGRLD